MPQRSDGRRAYPGGASGAGSAGGGGDQPVGGPAWQELSSQNLNLQLRVAELEALHGDDSAQSSGGGGEGGGGGGGGGGGSVHTSMRPGPATTRPGSHGGAQARSVEQEWAKVERLREEVCPLVPFALSSPPAGPPAPPGNSRMVLNRVSSWVWCSMA